MRNNVILYKIHNKKSNMADIFVIFSPIKLPKIKISNEIGTALTGALKLGIKSWGSRYPRN